MAAAAAIGGSRAGAADAPDGKALFESTCSSCHDAGKATAKRRTGDEWRQVVRKMQGIAAKKEKPFDDETAGRIAGYLAVAYGADQPPPKEAPAAPAKAQPAPVAPGKAADGPGKEEADEAEIPQAIGFVGGALILAMIAAGFLRARIGRRFLLAHRIGAVLVFLALGAHGTMLYLQFGPPKPAWHLLGSAGFLVVASGAVVGLLRRRIGGRWLTAHKALGLAALALAAAHFALHP